MNIVKIVITVFNYIFCRKCIYVEILDNSNCLNNTQIPNGMMKLKFRLQSKLNFPVITVRNYYHLNYSYSL